MTCAKNVGGGQQRLALPWWAQGTLLSRFDLPGIAGPWRRGEWIGFDDLGERLLVIVGYGLEGGQFPEGQELSPHRSLAGGEQAIGKARDGAAVQGPRHV